MGPCCQIPNHHSGYLLQSHAVEIEMCFPNKADPEMESAWLVWLMPDARKSSIKELCWKGCLHIVYPTQGLFLCLVRNVVCSLYKLTFHFSLWAPCKTKSPSSPHIPQASLLEVNVSAGPYLHLNATLLVKFFYTVLPPSTHTYTLDVILPSFALRTFWAMVQFTSCLRKLCYSAQVSREGIILVFGFPLICSPGPWPLSVLKKALSWIEWLSIA